MRSFLASKKPCGFRTFPRGVGESSHSCVLIVSVSLSTCPVQVNFTIEQVPYGHVHIHVYTCRHEARAEHVHVTYTWRGAS